ncbi:MAG TPA: SsrA-binding protein SmpB [Chloroflexota bacterium]|jgi:SsrA-binding protein
MPTAKAPVDNDATLAVNRRAYHDYFIEETYEAGLVLTGTEIKSLRSGKANLREGYARPRHGEIWLLNVHISPYEQGNRYNHEPTRDRKLLLHRRQITDLMVKVQRNGLTLVPLRLYLKHGRAKLELGLAKGKKQYDKRDAIAERDAKRDLDRELHRRDR